MNMWRSHIWRLLARLTGFIVGGTGGYLLVGFGAWLVLGAPRGDQQGLVMLMVVPVALFVGLISGFVGMRLAGKWVKAVSQDDPEKRNGHRDD